MQATQSVEAALLIFIGVALPSLGIYFFQAPSMALGLLFALLTYILIFSINYDFKLVVKATLKILVFVMPFIVIQGAINYFIFTSFAFEKYIKSIIYLSILISGCVSFVLIADKFPKNLILVFKAFFYFYVFFALLSICNVVLPNYDPKSVIFYREPSHFALDFLPFILTVSIFASFKKKILYLSIAFAIGLLLPNLTLIFGVILISFLVLDIKRYAICLLFFLAILLASQNNFWIPAHFYSEVKNIQQHSDVNPIEYIRKRLPIENDHPKKNLSLLTMQSGYERAYLNFLDTYGLGVGFQQFGHNGKMGFNMLEIILILGFPLCLYDGSFIGAKFVGEFGIVGIILILFYIFFAVKYAINLRKYSLKIGGNISSMHIFYSSCFVLFSIDIFLRGVGYFSSSSFFFIASMVALFLFSDGGVVKQAIKGQNENIGC